MNTDLQATIETAWEARDTLSTPSDRRNGRENVQAELVRGLIGITEALVDRVEKQREHDT